MYPIDVATRRQQTNEILQNPAYRIEKTSVKVLVRVKKDILAGRRPAQISEASPGVRR